MPWKPLLESFLFAAKCLFVLAHISGNNSFPQPLSAEEEEYHLTQYAKGERRIKEYFD